MHDIDSTDCGRETANDHGALLADWRSLREALQRSLSGHIMTAEKLEQRGHDVEAVRVRNQSSGIREALRLMDLIRVPA